MVFASTTCSPQNLPALQILLLEIARYPGNEFASDEERSRMSDEIKIEKGIPVPRAVKSGPVLEALRKMQVGDSILISAGERNNTHNRSKIANIKITTRQEGEKLRVWRVE